MLSTVTESVWQIERKWPRVVKCGVGVCMWTASAKHFLEIKSVILYDAMCSVLFETLGRSGTAESPLRTRESLWPNLLWSCFLSYTSSDLWFGRHLQNAVTHLGDTPVSGPARPPASSQRFPCTRTPPAQPRGGKGAPVGARTRAARHRTAPHGTPPLLKGTLPKSPHYFHTIFTLF